MTVQVVGIDAVAHVTTAALGDDVHEVAKEEWMSPKTNHAFAQL